jgi:hypothetical protein
VKPEENEEEEKYSKILTMFTQKQRDSRGVYHTLMV